MVKIVSVVRCSHVSNFLACTNMAYRCSMLENVALSSEGRDSASDVLDNHVVCPVTVDVVRISCTLSAHGVAKGPTG